MNYYCHLCENVFEYDDLKRRCKYCESDFIQELEDETLQMKISNAEAIEYDGEFHSNVDEDIDRESNDEYTIAYAESNSQIPNILEDLEKDHPKTPEISIPNLNIDRKPITVTSLYITDITSSNVSNDLEKDHPKIPEINIPNLNIDRKSMTVTSLYITDITSSNVSNDLEKDHPKTPEISIPKAISSKTNPKAKRSVQSMTHTSLPVTNTTERPDLSGNSQSFPTTTTDHKKISWTFNFFKKKTSSDDLIKDISIKATNVSPREECSICLAKYKQNSHVRLTQCGHKFHNQCLLTWAKMKKECPMCRYKFKSTFL